jgi:hypothetical protein
VASVSPCFHEITGFDKNLPDGDIVVEIERPGFSFSDTEERVNTLVLKIGGNPETGSECRGEKQVQDIEFHNPVCLEEISQSPYFQLPIVC